MLIRILLIYWGRRVCILKFVMLLKTNLTQQDTKNFSITNRLERVLFLIILNKLEHPSKVYRISYLLPLNPPPIGVPEVSLHQMTLTHLQSQASLLNQIYHLRVPQESFQMVHLFLVWMAILKKLITSNDTRLTIAIADPIIS